MAAVVVVLAGALVTSFRGQALQSARIVDQLLDVRRLVGESDALAWQLADQGTPNFTFSQTLRQDAANIASDLRLLARAHAPIHDVNTEFSGFEQELSVEQTLIAAKQLSKANLVALDGVDGTAQIVRASVDRLRTVYAARAATANQRLYRGTLAVREVSAMLAALLAAAFVAGRRRALIAERSALAYSERRFRALLHKASDAVLVINTERCITYATGAVLDLFSDTAEALVGRRLDEVVPPEQRAQARQLIDRAIRTGPSRTPSEWSLRRADGTIGYFEAQSANFLDDPDVKGVVVTVRDAGGRSRSPTSTLTVSKRSTTPLATPQAISCCVRSRGGSTQCCGAVTPLRDSAVTSSRVSSTR